MVNSPSNLHCELLSAGSSEIRIVAEMNKRLIEDEASRNRMSLDELESRLVNWVKTGWGIGLFRVDDVPIGYILFENRHDEYDKDDSSVYVRQFYIEREHRRKGLGRSAFELAAAQYYDGSAKITLDVLASNSAGMKFWESLGFRSYCTTLHRASPNRCRDDEESG